MKKNFEKKFWKKILKKSLPASDIPFMAKTMASSSLLMCGEATRSPKLTKTPKRKGNMVQYQLNLLIVSYKKTYSSTSWAAHFDKLAKYWRAPSRLGRSQRLRIKCAFDNFATFIKNFAKFFGIIFFWQIRFLPKLKRRQTCEFLGNFSILFKK